MMINETRILNEFIELVSVPCPSKDEKAEADLLVQKLQAMGLEVKVDDAGRKIGGTTGNVWAFLPGNVEGTAGLFFEAHMDSVPPTTGTKVVRRDGVLYSDGTTTLGGDDKVGIAAVLEAVRAVQEQVARLGFYSNSVENSLQVKLAERLGRISGYDDYRLFLCNSGAEANENALKLASFHTGRSKALAISKAFHGRTSGAVAVTDNPAISSPFNRTPNVEFTPLNDIGAMRAKLATREFAAVIVEGIQGVAGIHCPTDEFLRAVRAAATETGTQLVLDEIQSGYGRTGRFFAHQAAGIRPDLITTAKGMANGFPIGGVLIAPHFEARPGLLGTTFGGSHLACAAAIAVLEVIERDALVENAAKIGDYLLAELHKIGGLKEVRGRGLMIGIEIDGSGPELRKKLLFDKHIFTGGAGASTVRLLPALCLTKEMADRFLTAFDKVKGEK